jgi:hypothetical protein
MQNKRNSLKFSEYIIHVTHFSAYILSIPDEYV